MKIEELVIPMTDGINDQNSGENNSNDMKSDEEDLNENEFND